MLTAELLTQCLPGVSPATAKVFAPALFSAAEEFKINTPKRLAAFLAQVGHESNNLKALKENLNYSAEGLIKTFPKYFDSVSAPLYAKQAEMIANRVYALRMGNGPEQSGDGYKYRGRGLIQLTGHDNYVACGKGLNHDLLGDSTYLETTEGACRSAAWFWQHNGLNELADVGDFVKITKKINGGTIGLADRDEKYRAALQVLNGQEG